MCLKKKLMAIGLAVIAGVTFSIAHVYACWPWINVNNYRLEPGRSARFHLTLGHRFPFGHSFFGNDRIGEIYILSPEGERQEVRKRVLRDGEVSQVQFESKEELKEGTHLVVLEAKGRYRASVAEGRRTGSRKELEAQGYEIVGEVRLSQMWAKAIVNVGEKSGEGFSRILGHGLEIVPLEDPNTLRTNDVLPLQIFHHGEPLGEFVRVYATYMGFSTGPDVFAYSTWALRQGKASIRILEPGIWRIFVRHEFPHPDPEIADRSSYVANLTFEVKP